MLVSVEGSVCSPSAHWAARTLFHEIPGPARLWEGGLRGKGWIWGVGREEWGGSWEQGVLPDLVGWARRAWRCQSRAELIGR